MITHTVTSSSEHRHTRSGVTVEYYQHKKVGIKFHSKRLKNIWGPVSAATQIIKFSHGLLFLFFLFNMGISLRSYISIPSRMISSHQSITFFVRFLLSLLFVLSFLRVSKIHTDRTSCTPGRYVFIAIHTRRVWIKILLIVHTNTHREKIKSWSAPENAGALVRL